MLFLALLLLNTIATGSVYLCFDDPPGEPIPRENLQRWNQVYNRRIKALVMMPAEDLPESVNPYGLTLGAGSRCIRKAEKYVYEVKQILPYNMIEFIYIDDNCSDVMAPVYAVEHYKKDEVDVIIGLCCSLALSPVARMAPYWYSDVGAVRKGYKKFGVPVITVGGMVAHFSDKENMFKTLTRINGNYNQLGLMTIYVMRHLKLIRAAIYYEKANGTDTTEREWILFSVSEKIKQVVYDDTLKEWFLKERPQIPMKNLDHRTLLNDLKKLSFLSNVILLCASPQAIRKIMLAAHELGMTTSGEYVFFNIDVSINPVGTKPWKQSKDNCRTFMGDEYTEDKCEEENEKARLAYQALKTITLKQSNSSRYRETRKKIRDVAHGKYGYNATHGQEYELNSFVSAFYDAVILYALALNETITENNQKNLGRNLDGHEITKKMWNRTFEGITGEVTIDENGDRYSDYSLLAMDPKSGEFVTVVHYLGATKTLTNSTDADWHWVKGKPPRDTPVCGYDRSKCPDSKVPWQVYVAIGFLSIFLIFLIFLFIMYKRFKLERELAAMTWRIRWDEIAGRQSTAVNNFKNKLVDGHLKPLLRRQNSRTSVNTRGSNCSMESIVNDEKVQIFAKTTKFRGSVVAIKKLEISKPKIDVNRPMLMELKRMKDIQHEHIARFVGACIDYPHYCVVTEYCPKGSLQDILENEDISLDKMMIFSLIHDIVKAMDFIHASDFRSHGNMKSSNCVVDSRFVLKVTDFGLCCLRTECDPEDPETHAFWTRRLWTAPELLRMDKPPLSGSVKGDVYSFAIILHEMSSRNGVFYIDNEKDITPYEIIERVKIPQQPPFRPSVDENRYEDVVINLMTKCWAENPQDRPDFPTIRRQVRQINRANESGNIVDNLLKRMEKYAEDLEAKVEERTRDYLEEKRKAEDLLYNMLPRPVATQLIRKEPVKAETFKDVTIYFSDIVGFTSLSSQSTPIEVVQLLNDLYTCFDSIVGHFDVYKVETIGDAYMVVSGLPVRNGNLHAREIARMSLELLKTVKSFTIRHRPQEQLKLRIGIHSGSVCAGVVGLKMPRYCLFGDTVNTASRMESNGLPLKIHVSETTKSILDTFGTFELELRGQVEMKGKGLQTTYWLLGEKNSPTTDLPPIT